MAKRPLILVTNDDGVLAPGLRVLAECAAALGEVLVCAPDTERSGSSHSITLHSHLRVNPVSEGWWSVNGTPVDCVYLAALHLCPHPPDLVLSGINPGYNLGTDVFYSGTVGGAAEGWIRGASALAVSVHRDDDPHIALPAISFLAQKLLAQSDRHLWNVNVGRPRGEGDRTHAAPRIQITRLGRRPYLDQVEQRQDLQGRPYFWIGGPPDRAEEREGEDTWSVANGQVSVTPLELDITSPYIERVRSLFSHDDQQTEG